MTREPQWLKREPVKFANGHSDGSPLVSQPFKKLCVRSTSHHVSLLDSPAL